MHPPDRPAPLPPLLVLSFGLLATSTAAILIRFAQASTPSLVIAAYRLSIAALLLAPLAWLRQRAELRSLSRRELGLALLSGFFLCLHFAAWITSLEYTTVASSVVLVTTTPLWVALLSPFTIKEPLTRPVKAGMGLALIGGIIIGLSDVCSLGGGGLQCPDLASLARGNNALLGDLLAIAGAVMAAFYLLIGRRLRSRMSLIGYIFVVYGMAAVALLVFTVAARQPLTGYPPAAYLWFVLLAVVPQLLGHSSFNWSLRYISAAFVSITLLGEPIGSTILAYLILKEVPSALKIFGAILILAGIYTASRSEAQVAAVPA